mgnify:CR=1 FL=1
MSNDCSICGGNIDNKYKITTECNHTFHYECLMNSYIYQKKKKSCPICRSSCGLLPIINGLKKPIKLIHYNYDNEITNDDMTIKYINEPCNYIFKKGKNKGNKCNKNCYLGYYQCKYHLNK